MLALQILSQTKCILFQIHLSLRFANVKGFKNMRSTNYCTWNSSFRKTPSPINVYVYKYNIVLGFTPQEI